MKQLLISDGATAAYTAGLLAPGAIDVVGLSADGPVSVVPGQTIADFSAIRIIQGTAAGRANVVSPWIDGSSVSRWVGQSYAAQVAQTSTLTITGTSSAAFNATVKVTSRAIGQAQFERRSWTIAIPTGTAQNTIAGLINTQINAAALPGFLASVSVGANVITFTGQTFDSDPYRVLSSFETQTDIDATFTTDAAVAAGNTPDLGNGGDGNLIVELEASLQGMGRGYYDRVQLPVVPPAYAVAATTYDLYKLGFGNAAPGSIRGVDNYREIIIASPAGDADGAIFENKINPWLNSCPGSFAAVQL